MRQSEKFFNALHANSARMFWRKYLVFALSLFLIAISVLTFLECRLGSDSLTVLLDGLHHSLGIPYYVASAIYNGTIVVAGYLFARRYMGLGSILYLLHIVLFIGLFEQIFPYLRIPELPVSVRMIILILGQTTLSLGISLLICASFGMNSLDALLHRLEEHVPYPYGWLRTGTDLVFVLAGFGLGGKVGIGTILSVLFTGIMIVFFRLKLESHVIRFFTR